VISKLRFTFAFTVNFMTPHERSILCNMVCNIATDNKSPELFGCLRNVELMHIFLFGLPEDEPSHISVAVFCAVDDFLKFCNRFWKHPHDFVHSLWEIHSFLLYFCIFVFFVHADLLQLYIYTWCAWCVDLRFQMLYLILLMNFWKDSSDAVYSFWHFFYGF